MRRGFVLDARHPGDVRELGLDRTWTDGGDGDAAAALLGVKRLAEGEHEGLAGVGGRARERLEGRDRSDVDDRTSATLAHSRHVAAGQVDDGLDVEADHADHPSRVVSMKRPPRAEARVVDEHLDRALQAMDLPGQAVALLGVDQIARQRGASTSCSASSAARLLRRSSRRATGSRCAPAGELARDRGADSRRGAGDQRGAAYGWVGQRQRPGSFRRGPRGPRAPG